MDFRTERSPRLILEEALRIKHQAECVQERQGWQRSWNCPGRFREELDRERYNVRHHPAEDSRQVQYPERTRKYMLQNIRSRETPNVCPFQNLQPEENP